MIPIGFSLQPDARFLDLVDPLLRGEVDYYEVAPETLWRPRPGGDLEPNAFAERILDLARRTARPFVAHGVGYSVGCAEPDRGRRERWLRRIRADHERFRFRWYSDHLGTTVLDGRELALPLPLTYDAHTAELVVAALLELRRVVEPAALETTAFPFYLADPMEEPAFLERVLGGADAHLVLDLHNVWTNATNAGFDAERWIERLPAERVIEIHLSGGGWSEPAWLPAGRRQRLDSHDAAVPEPVWELLEGCLGRFPRLRGITLERMEGTVEEHDVAWLRDELRRARDLAHSFHGD